MAQDAQELVFEAIGLLERLDRLQLQPLFLDAVGNFHVHDQQAGRAPVAAGHGDGHPVPVGRALLAVERVHEGKGLALEGLARLDHAPGDRRDDRGGLGHQLEQVAADHALGRNAQQPAEGGVHPAEHQLGVQVRDAGRRVVDDAGRQILLNGQILGARRHQLLDVLARADLLGDLEPVGRHAHDRPRVVFEGLVAEGEVAFLQGAVG
ncbi:hypothetical protein D3C72_1508030 [compost metagenome]